MTKDEALKLALEAMESVTVECNNFHHPKKDQNHHWAKCPPVARWDKAITAIKKALAQPEPMRLRCGDILRSIETDELCTVWSTSTTGKTLIKWGDNDFCGYTAEQIGELFWLEPLPDDLELSAEKSDNYAAFHAGYRFAVAHSLAQLEQEQTNIEQHEANVQKFLGAPQPEQEPVAWVCMKGEKHDIDFDQPEIDAIPVGTFLYTTPPQRTWVGLSKEQLATTDWSADFRAGALWAEAKLKERNDHSI